MVSNALKIMLMSAGLLVLAASSASAQELEVFKQKMADAADMTKKDLNEALRMYLEIRTQFSGPEVDYSLGRTYQRLGQCHQAKDYYSSVMQYNLADDHPIYQRAVKAFDEIATCESWQKFHLSCEIPKGAHVEVDGERIASCLGRPYSLGEGEHVFRLVDAAGRTAEERRTARTNAPDEHVELKFPPETVTVEKTVEIERDYVLKDRFHPALYWGLMTGGAVFIAGGGFFLSMANNAYAEEQKFADIYAISGGDDNKKKADDARSRVKTGNALAYTFAGIGAAALVTGVALAIVNEFSDKERVEVTEGVSAFVLPSAEGVSVGLGMAF